MNNGIEQMKRMNLSKKADESSSRKDEICSSCNGEGEILVSEECGPYEMDGMSGGEFVHAVAAECPKCNGTGKRG
jgi:DnaJ-class molecular chaperone